MLPRQMTVKKFKKGGLYSPPFLNGGLSGERMVDFLRA